MERLFIRQRKPAGFLEGAIEWVSKGKIEGYMSAS